MKANEYALTQRVNLVIRWENVLLFQMMSPCTCGPQEYWWRFWACWPWHQEEVQTQRCDQHEVDSLEPGGKTHWWDVMSVILKIRNIGIIFLWMIWFTLGLISMVKNNLKLAWGCMEWSFFSSCISQPGARWTFSNITHLPDQTI